MKLLFDENLSPRLVDEVAAVYPDSRHVDHVGLRAQSDAQIWGFARDHGYVLVSKDSDFRELSSIYGAPPKVVWLTVANSGTTAIRDLLLQSSSRIGKFADDAEEALLVLTARQTDEA